MNRVARNRLRAAAILWACACFGVRPQHPCGRPCLHRGGTAIIGLGLPVKTFAKRHVVHGKCAKTIEVEGFRSCYTPVLPG